jgi:uncharacterized protein (TIGR02996 family)
MTGMTQDQALLRAILDEPDGDAPRLVYADWLEERGRPGDAERAEFIRAQIAKALLSSDDPKWIELHRREHALLGNHGEAWVSNLPRMARWDCRPMFHRGFVEELICTVSQFLKVAAGTVRVTPLRRLRLACNSTDQAARIAELARCRHLSRITDLDLTYLLLSDEEARQLAACPYLDNVSRLRVSISPYLGEPGRQALRERFGERAKFP